MLVLVICFISCFQGTIQSIYNPLNLDSNGKHVCSRRVTKAERYYVTISTIRFTYYTTSCGTLGWSRCGRSKQTTGYRNIRNIRYKTETYINCCGGWKQQYSGSRDCSKAICSKGCHPNNGNCIAPENCRCDAGWGGNSCQTDINECASNNGGCDQVCTNIPGSYQCGCNAGYIGTIRCTDVDECQRNPKPCTCSVSGCGATCINQVPGFTCSCGNGFKLRSGAAICDDVNECLTAKGGCSQRCYNSPGSFSCGCFRGYLLMNDSTTCKDVNECQSNNGFCTHQCVNIAGSYFCQCNPGFYLDSNRRTCSDHDECRTGYHGCEYKCNNVHGSFYCSCAAGYALNKDNRTCSDVNECTPVYVKSLNRTIIPAGCDQRCHNTPGNYTCSCKRGYQLLYDGKRCRDVDECKVGTHSCGQICHNTFGSYGCSCFHGYKLRADLRSCVGLPCETISVLPNGKITCTGLVTNETCSFTCNNGYEIQGSERRTCLNSSEWDGQQTFCNVKSCGRLRPPRGGKVFLPCYFTLGSICRIGCNHGFFGFGNNFATCRVTNSSEVAWDVGNLTCEEIILCKPNPCRHGGRCTVINSRQFSCDCDHTGYEGDLCERGIVTLPDFPKLISGNPSDSLELQAKPDNSLIVHLNPTPILTIQPRELTIRHPESKVEFQVIGHKSGIGMVSCNFDGVNKYDFNIPENSFVFIGRNISSWKSLYTRLGLLAGELPTGCKTKVIKKYPACDIRMAFHRNSSKSNSTVIESGPVHIIAPDNTTIPLSLAGYNFSSPHQSREEIMERLIWLTNITEDRQTGNQRPSAHGCSDIQITGTDLIELIQKDALPKSFMSYFTDQLPLWLKVKVKEDNELFDIENSLATLVQITDAHTTHPNCKFPIINQSVVILYRPMVNFNISVENEQLSLSSKGSCFATDICETGMFVTLSSKASDKVKTMQFMKDMANGGWKLQVSSFGFTTPRRYSRNLNNVPDGHLAMNFTNFHYNLWWRGSGNILLANSNLSLKMTGEAFVFAKSLNAVFTSYFSKAISFVFHGSVEFNISLQALGQRFTLTFNSSEIIGKGKFGGTVFLASDVNNDCQVPQGFVFTLRRPSKPFSKSPLSNIIRSNRGLKYLQIYHSFTGGNVISANDNNNNLRFLQWQAQEIKRILFDVKRTVPELQLATERWEVVTEEMLTTVIKARRILSQAADWLELKVLVEKLDADLDIITRAFDLLVAQLHPHKNRTSIEMVIDRLIRLKADLPKTISLSFFKSSIQQNFAGFRFLLVAQICHKRLCFPNMNSSIWSLRGNQCGTSPARQEAGLLVEGVALQSVSLGSLITIPTGGALKVLLTRNQDLIVSTFEGIVNLLGLTKNTAVQITGNELSFVIWGPIFGEFDALVNVKARTENVVDWNSIMFAVEGRMNRSSRLYKLLENRITNYTNTAAKEATRRLANAQFAFNDAKKNAQLVKHVLISKQSAVEELRIKKAKAAQDLDRAHLNYHVAQVEFNRTFFFYQNDSFVCEIKECNYTCTNGCVIPDLCQNPLIIRYLERNCDTKTKTITVKELRTRIVQKSYEVRQFKTEDDVDCGSFEPVTGCSETSRRVPAKSLIVPYNDTETEWIDVKQTIKEVTCTDHTEKTKPGGYGPPYKCCKQYGCLTKVIDRQCITKNNKCENLMNELKVSKATMNVHLQPKFQALQNTVERVRSATFTYEKARIRHQSAVTLLKQVEAHMEQRLSAVEITNASMSHVKRMIDVGLRIAQAINSSDNKKVIDVGEMQFSFSKTSGNTRQIVFQTNVSTLGEQQTSVSFLLDFDQVQRSVSSASKTIIAKLFPGKVLRRKRSILRDSAIFTRRQHLSFIDYPQACLFTNKTRLYLRSMCKSLEEVLASIRELNVNMSTGLHELERLGQTINVGGLKSSVNASSGYPNSSFVTEYIEMIQFLKDENVRLTNDSLQSWNDTLDAWRAFLEVFTSEQNFTDCSGTQDCIETFFEKAKELYEFEDSPRALAIKDALPQLKKAITSLTTEALSMLEAEHALNRAASLLNKTRDDSVLCGGTPHITSSSQGEIILFPGDSLSLNCSSEKEERLKYTWRRNNDTIGELLDGTLYLDNVTKESEGAYVCVVSNNKGSTLSNSTIVLIKTKPKITQHPQPQRVVFRSQMPVVFICNATAEPLPIFQWFFEPTNSPALKMNETMHILYIANPHPHQEGYYFCEATNEHGKAVSQKARLDVLNYTIALRRMLIAFNLTTYCWLTSNSSNSSFQNPLSCSYNAVNELSASLKKNLTSCLRHSLARSLNLSVKLISQLKYYSRYPSKSSVVFIVDVYIEPWKKENFTSYMEIVEAIAVFEAKLVEKLKKLDSDMFNETFKVPWNNTTLLGEPGSILVYPLSPKCPEGQSLNRNGFICENCPAGSHYNAENATCVKCPLGTYQPFQGQKECISCGKNFTTVVNATVEKSDCIEMESPTNNIPTTRDAQSTLTASLITASSSSLEVLEVKLFFKGKVDSVDIRHKEQILQLVEEEVIRFLSTFLIVGKKSEITITEHRAKVLLFVSAAGVDEGRLQELLSEGIEIEHRGRKMRFNGKMTTSPSTNTLGPTKYAGEIESDEKLLWKLPVIIGGPTLIIMLIIIIIRRTFI